MADTNVPTAAPDSAGGVTYIEFSDAEGLTIEASRPQTGTQQAAPPTPQLPADLRPAAEHPLQKIMREKYEQRAREAFARGRTVPNVKLQGATWSDAVDMGMEWLLEAGVERRVYRPGSPQVEDMKHAHRVHEAREYFYSKNSERLKQRKPLEPVTDYSGSFYPFGVLRAGRNPTQQFVGSYNIDIYPNQNNTITFVLTNVTSLKSGTYHIGPEYPRNTVGLGGNQTQIYTWTEPARLPAYTK